MALARTIAFLLSLVCLAAHPFFVRAESPAAKRGQDALLSRPLLPPAWSLNAYQDLWKIWGLRERPDAETFARLLREHYGSAPGLPTTGLDGLQKTKAFAERRHHQLLDMPCGHLGKAYVGLPTGSIFRPLSGSRSRGWPAAHLLYLSATCGTTEAGAMAEFLLGCEPDLRLRTSRFDLGLHDEICLTHLPGGCSRKRKPCIGARTLALSAPSCSS